jgi:hypothetical protein
MRVRRRPSDNAMRRAHRPGHAHAEVVGILVLALTSVSHKRAAFLREEAATIHAWGSRLESGPQRQYVQESVRNAHRKERRRQSAFELISKECPAAKSGYAPAEAGRLAVTGLHPRERGCVDAQLCERGQRGDGRRHGAGEAVLGEVPAPQRARAARASRQRDRTGGGAAYRHASLVSIMMLAGIGPVKPFLATYLITHSYACGRKASAASTRARPCVGMHIDVSAVNAEIVGGTLPEKRFSLMSLRRSVPVQHARVGRETARAAARRTARPAW